MARCSVRGSGVPRYSRREAVDCCCKGVSTFVGEGDDGSWTTAGVEMMLMMLTLIVSVEVFVHCG